MAKDVLVLCGETGSGKTTQVRGVGGGDGSGGWEQAYWSLCCHSVCVVSPRMCAWQTPPACSSPVTLPMPSDMQVPQFLLEAGFG